MFKPSKKLGQNFLADKKILDRIIDVANIEKEDVVLEIGPGQGSLTHALCKKAGGVVAVEKDRGLFEYLKGKFSGLKNLDLVNDDILRFLELRIKNYELRNKRYKIVANIPYYLTSYLLRKIFSLENKPEIIVLMIQKEVAERIVAQKGNMNLLAVSVQMFADSKIEFYVNKKSFWPQPKVDSAIIKLKVKSKKLKVDEEKFFDLVKAGFGSKRKLLTNNLSDKLKISKEKVYNIFKEIGLDEKVRAQDLGIEDWKRLLLSIYG